MNQLIWQLTEWRGELAWVILAVMAYVVVRCAMAARKQQGGARRQLLGCSLGTAVLMPAAIHPAMGIMPLLAAIGLLVVATGATLKSQAARGVFSAMGLGLLLGTSGMVSAGQVLNLGSGPSMWPAASKGLSLFLIRPLEGPLRRGQQVEFHVPMKEAAPDPDTGWPAGRYHKRVFGLPGDQVTMEDFRILVNGIVVADCQNHRPEQELPQYGLWLCNGRFASSLTQAAPVNYRTVWGQPDIWMDGRREWKIPEGMALVLGDNLVESGDSRQRGLIPTRWIVGKVQSSW